MLKTRLRQKRMEHGFTQSKMSEYLDMQVRSYQKYEEGSRYPPYSTLIKIADIFNVSLDYLLCRDEFKNSPEAPSDEQKTNLPNHPIS